MSNIRCIGIATGGGDAPGLNAVIRAATRAAILKYNWKVIGIPDGFDGLIWPEKSFELTLKDVSGILPRGGTILGTTSRGNPFQYEMGENRGEVRDISDQLIANGVTIESGAQFSFTAVANKKLTNGSVFTAINNTSANAVSGAFANLPDGSILTAGRNNFQASYEGGDGNDLTLTVVP